MPSRVFFQELKRFLKENIKIYSMFAIIGILLFGVTLFFQNKDNNSNKESVDIQQDARMATFVFYVENAQQNVYVNSNFLDSIFLSQEYINRAEVETDVEISELIEKQINSDFVPTLLDRGYIGVGRDVHNETMMFQAKLGTEEENLAVANYFYDLVINDEISFLANKEVYLVREPYLIEMVEENVSASNETNAETSVIVTVLKGIIFVIVGLFVGIIFAFLYHLFTSKINYSFSYEFDETDVFFVIRDETEELITTIVNPNYGQKLIVSEENLPDSLKAAVQKNDESNYHFSNNLIMENPEQDFKEIVFVIIENQTDKRWYYKQREILKKFNRPVKIIQVPLHVVTGEIK